MFEVAFRSRPEDDARVYIPRPLPQSSLEKGTGAILYQRGGAELVRTYNQSKVLQLRSRMPPI